MSSFAARLQDQFRGAMVGALLGDCLGSPLEFVSNRSLPMERVIKQFEKYEAGRGRSYLYTDDTAMARQVADSLASRRGVDPSDLARRFAEEFERQPHRGYGRNVVDVFEKLSKQKPNYGEPFLPASEQFDGSGSFGNGAAMRVHPVALFFHGSVESEMVAGAKNSALITHSHRNGYNGAIILSAAVRLALMDVSAAEMVDRLITLAKTFGEPEGDDSQSYVSSLRVAKKCLELGNDERAADLGNDVAALTSVPLAVYCHLRSEAADESLIKRTSADRFKRTLQLAYSYGGDTDTIGSMAGAITGAAVGCEQISEKLKARCEGLDDAVRQADRIHEIVSEKK